MAIQKIRQKIPHALHDVSFTISQIADLISETLLNILLSSQLFPKNIPGKNLFDAE